MLNVCFNERIMKILVILLILEATVETTRISVLYDKVVPLPIKRLFQSHEASQINNPTTESNKIRLFNILRGYEKLIPSPIKQLFQIGDYANDSQIDPKEGNPDQADVNVFSRITSDAYEKFVPSHIKRFLHKDDDTSVFESQLKESSPGETNLSFFSRVTNNAYEKFVPSPVKHFFYHHQNDDDTGESYIETKEGNYTPEEIKPNFFSRVTSDVYEKLVPSSVKGFFRNNDTSSESLKSIESNYTPEAVTLSIFSRTRNNVYETLVPLPIKRLLLSKDSENQPEANLTISSEAHTTSFIGKITNTVYDKIVPTPIKRIFQKDENTEGITHIKAEINNDTTNNISKEHGNLDFFGRDIVKNVGKTISKFGDKFTKSSKGLDSDPGFFKGIIDGFKNKVRAVFPGTLWCGDGDVADDKRELGLFYLTDNCCREHDSCKDSMMAGEIRNGLENSGLFTRSNCECDDKFYNCLKTANSIISNKIGFTYFTVLGPQCFKVDYPVIKCNTTSWKRCIEYVYDTTKDKYEQWFDNPIY